MVDGRAAFAASATSLRLHFLSPRLRVKPLLLKLPKRPRRCLSNDRIGITTQRSNLPEQPGIAAVARRVEAVAHEAIAPDPFDRRA